MIHEFSQKHRVFLGFTLQLLLAVGLSPESRAGTLTQVAAGEWTAKIDFVEPELTQFPVNKMTDLTVTVMPKDASVTSAAPLATLRLEFDARMPAHNHGMMVTPKVVPLKAGMFRITGVKLHMAGDWELTLKIQSAKNEQKVMIPVKI